ncbi:MAG TPA: hypothetical protein PLG09_01800 [Syntrophomonadaceae bacterium]|nr:hypothetical protein [Syntrophomonadaceae bacterium]HPU47650.1 hypothetical protein [Syntrophomonadaceae bacterium]
MNCQLFDRYLFDYCDGNVYPTLKLKMDEHLRECPRCNNQVKLTDLENQVLRDKSDLPALADDFTARIMQQIIGAEQAATIHFTWSKKPFPSRVRKIAVTAAAAGLILVLAVFAQQIIPYAGTQVADSPPVGIGNSSTLEPSNNDLRSEPEMNETAVIAGKTQKEQSALRTMSSEEADASAATEEPSARVSSTPNKVSAADQVTLQLAMAENTEAVSYDAESTGSVTGATTTPPEMMFRKNREVNSPSRQGFVSEGENQKDTTEDLPKPTQVPDTFTLMKVIKNYTDAKGSIIEYHYASTDNRSLVISLNYVKTPEPITLMNKDVMSSEPVNYPEKVTLSPFELAYTIEVGGETYQVTLNGDLSAEELGELADTISFTKNNAASSQ